MKYDIKEVGLSEQGIGKIKWAEKDMPVLRQIKEKFSKSKLFKNITIGACLHITSETANLARTLASGGARVFLCASNPLSTQDDVAAALVKEYKIPVFAIKGEDKKKYFSHLNSVLDQHPDIVIDDGADLISDLHKNRRDQLSEIVGGMEETTTGVVRLRALAKYNRLAFPVIAVNDSMTKHFFDNRYGTGQSTIDGILRATNRLLAGSTFVVAGYGFCGRGLSERAEGMGANVIVTETNPVRALEATLDGFRVMPMREAAKVADFICTVTGDKHVLGARDFTSIKNGCIISNAGHFDIEIDIQALKKMSKNVKSGRPFVEEYKLKNGKTVYLLAQGRLVNLGSAEGHPSSVMDMSFANQALGAEYLIKNKGKLTSKVYTIPQGIDEKIARLKLQALGIKIDNLTSVQKKYLSSWEEGTS